MAVPSNPIAIDIITEGLRRAGSGALDLFGQANSSWIQEIFNDIALKAGANTRLNTLRTTEVQITTTGQSKYDFASDFDTEIDITLLDGDHRDTATAGGNTSITFAADEDVSEAGVVGEYILITGGTGSEGLRQCTAYNTTTLVATVDRAWDTNPDSTSTYLIVNETTNLNKEGLQTLGFLSLNTDTGKPTAYAKINEGVNRRFILDRPPDLSTYGLLVSYYVNLHEVNLTIGSTVISNIYQNWRMVLVAGIYYRALEYLSDPRYVNATRKYEQLVNDLLIKETAYDDEGSSFQFRWGARQ